MNNEAQNPARDAVVALSTDKTFGSPLVTNNFRSVIVEAIVSLALGKSWDWCSADWAPFDFLHEDGTRLEVKQSAALQTWSTTNGKPSRAVYDIAERKGFYEDGARWVARQQRYADMYVFAHHPLIERAIVDHRDPYQWDFYVAATGGLPPPPAKSLPLPRARELAPLTRFDDLASTVDELRKRIRSTR